MKMKLSHVLLSPLILLAFTAARSQNVGIGTNTPEQKLEIEGSGEQLLRIHTTSVGSSVAGLELVRGGEFSATDWQIINDGGALKFLSALDNFNTPGDENMRITSSGNIGIGTTSPQSHVHIAGAGDQMLLVHNTTFGGNMAGIDLLRSSDANGTDWRIVNDGGVLKFFDGVDNFTSAGDENMRISQGGNVGIGLTSPQARMHIMGTSFLGTSDGGNMLRIGSSSYLAFDNNEIAAKNSSNEASTLYLQYWGGNLSLCSNDDGQVGIGLTNPSAKLHVVDGTDASLAGGGQLVLGPVSGSNLAFDGNEILARNNGAEAPLFLQISGGDVLMTPNENGQVGIGVTSMANMPDDSYLLAVDGKIIAEEMRVEMSGSWPDYVFDPDYNLGSLGDLETEISRLGHLPGIPAASVVEDEGFDLGDMQARMLEKIEELTLYMIQANKEIEALQKANTDLQKQIEALRQDH